MVQRMHVLAVADKGITHDVNSVSVRLPMPWASPYIAKPVQIMKTVPSTYMKNMPAAASGLWPCQGRAWLFMNR